jgi:EAL domain-containing protein (putative c-di-GMP-specific phosphodiesterase class I)
MSVAVGTQAIVTDEVGLSYGVVEPYRLKCTYQPVFARQGATLSPVAVSCGITMERAGQPVPADILDGLTSERRALCLGIGRRLAIRNLMHFSADDFFPELILNLTAEIEKPHAEIDALLTEAAAEGFWPSQICFDLSALADVNLPAALLDGVDMPFALDLASASALWAERAPSARPRLVRLPSSWTRRIAAETDLRRGFHLLVATLRRHGALVQVEGICNEAQLRAALAAGADRFQGDFLASSARAGTDIDVSPRAFADLIGAHPNVVPLSA